MLRKLTTVTAPLLIAGALVPAVAGADVKLGGAPTLRVADDASQATLRFASDRLPRDGKGRITAKVIFAGGQRVGALQVVGRHGDDVVYRARVTSQRDFRVGTKYTVRIRIAGQADLVRKVTALAV